MTYCGVGEEEVRVDKEREGKRVIVKRRRKGKRVSESRKQEKERASKLREGEKASESNGGSESGKLSEDLKERK